MKTNLILISLLFLSIGIIVGYIFSNRNIRKKQNLIINILSNKSNFTDSIGEKYTYHWQTKESDSGTWKNIKLDASPIHKDLIYIADHLKLESTEYKWAYSEDSVEWNEFKHTIITESNLHEPYSKGFNIGDTVLTSDISKARFFKRLKIANKPE